MPIKFTCPHCRVSMTIPDSFAGRKAKCPACGNPVTIPGEAPAEMPEKTVSRELGDWYRRMTGADSKAPRTALDEIHRETDVDVSEIVTKWDEDEDEDESWRHESEPAAHPRSKAPDRPRRRRRSDARDEDEAGTNMLLIGGGAALALLLIVVVVVMVKGGSSSPQGTGAPQAAPAALSTPAQPQAQPSAVPQLSAAASPTPSPTPEKTPSPEEKARRNLAYADDAVNRFDFGKAAEYYRKYLDFDPKNAEVWKKLIGCYRKAKDDAKALETVGEALKNIEADADMLRLKVDLEVELGKITEAFATYEQLFEKTPEDGRMDLLLEMFNMALTYGSERQSKAYLDKAWGYLQKLKSYIEDEEFEEYKTTLKEEYQRAGFDAPF